MSNLACYDNMCTDHALHAEMEHTLVETQHNHSTAYMGHMIWSDCGVETRSRILIAEDAISIIQEKILKANCQKDQNYCLIGHWILHNLERHFLIKNVIVLDHDDFVQDVMQYEVV